MKNEVLLYCIIFVPILGSFILPLTARISDKLRNFLSLIFVIISFLFSLILLPLAIKGETLTIAHTLVLGINFVFVADRLAIFMALVSSFVGAVIVFYSFSYISHYKNQNEYYLMVVLFLGSMMGLIYSGNLIFLYLFWEITALVCWRLIGFFREKDYVLKADKAFLVTVFGALVMLIGFIMLYHQTGSFDLSVIKDKLENRYVSNMVVFLILFGILSKSATLPFHSWLPDAGVAPSPVTALLHAAVLVKIGVYVFARLFVTTMTLDPHWHTIVPIIAGISSIVSAGAALLENNIKRIIAYSTISQIGFIFLGLSIGNTIGVAGGLLYILMHGLSKAGLFLCAGIVEQNTHTKDIRELGGLIKTMPITALSFLFCAFSVMGIPPFGGFFSKYMVIAGAINNNQLVIAFIFFVGAILTILYLLRLFITVFFGELKINAKEKSCEMVWSVAFLGLLSLLSGICIAYPSKFVELVVQQILR